MTPAHFAAFAAPLLASLLTPQELPPRPAGQTEPNQPSEGAPLIVTARKVEERLQDVPVSVSVVDGAAIERSGARSVREATGRVPNLLITELSSRRLSFPFIRGIGSGVGEPAVVTYIDGVPQLSVGSTNLPPVDLERIEVLRGPQGTLYGRNALGGVLQMVSARPARERETELSTTFGNFGQQDFRAHFSGPLGGGRDSNGVGATMTLLSSRRNGYTTNRSTGNDIDSRESLFGRAQVVFAPSENSELRLAVHAENADDGGFVLAPLNAGPGGPGLREDPFTIDQDFEGRVQRDIFAPSIHFQHFGDTFDVTSVTAFTDWDVDESSDFDFTNIDGVRRRTLEDQSYLYQEVRLNSSGDERLRWVFGAAGFLADSGRSAANEFRPGGVGIFFPAPQVGVDTNDGSFDDLGLSVFGQATVPVSDDIELTAGLRYDREEKDADIDHTFVTGGFTAVDESRSFDESFDQVSPTVSALWRATESINLYAFASRAFKAGGFNLTAPGNQFFFDPETSWTYELGVRHAVTESIGVRVAAFLIDWDDMQLSLFDATAGGYVANAGKSTSQGLEIEVDARLSDEWSTYGSVGLLDTEFDEFTDSFGMDDSGNDLPFAPEHTLALGLQHSRLIGRGLRLEASTEAQRVGEFFYDASNLESESYTLLSVSLGLRADRWRLAIVGRNLLDEEYVPVAFQVNPADPTFFVGENAAPRTFGVTLGFSF